MESEDNTPEQPHEWPDKDAAPEMLNEDQQMVAMQAVAIQALQERIMQLEMQLVDSISERIARTGR